MASESTGLVEVELSVTGMHCGSCVALIEEELLGKEGVASASVNLEAERASVSYDPTAVSIDDLQAAVRAAGEYTATPVG